MATKKKKSMYYPSGGDMSSQNYTFKVKPADKKVHNTYVETLPEKDDDPKWNGINKKYVPNKKQTVNYQSTESEEQIHNGNESKVVTKKTSSSWNKNGGNISEPYTNTGKTKTTKYYVNPDGSSAPIGRPAKTKDTTTSVTTKPAKSGRGTTTDITTTTVTKTKDYKGKNGNPKNQGGGESHYQYKVTATSSDDHKSKVKGRDDNAKSYFDRNAKNKMTGGVSSSGHYEYKDSKGNLRTGTGKTKNIPTAPAAVRDQVKKDVKKAPFINAKNKAIDTVKKTQDSVSTKIADTAWKATQSDKAKQGTKKIANAYDKGTTKVANALWDATQSDKAKQSRKEFSNKANAKYNEAKKALSGAWNNLKKKAKKK